VRRFLKRFRLFYRYNVSGIVSFVLELAILYACIQWFGLSYLIAVPVAFALSTVAQYIICHWWVFKRSGRSVPFEYAYFTLILLSGMVWTFLIVTLLVQTFQIDVYSARILAGIFTGLWDYYLNARFNFRAHPFLR
jgi:putative flippase GtrA